MFTSVTSWLLRPYIAFQYGKSSVKKLYKYNRTKKKSKVVSQDDNKQTTLVNLQESESIKQSLISNKEGE